MEITKENFLKLPQIPAVYTFWKGETPIYIGKSINLKSRLNSYLNLHLGPKTRQMVSEASKVTFIEVTSELESLLLESSLIKQYKPKYNIVLKDDKHALYIKITNDNFPRVITSRVAGDFGPFPSSKNVKNILKLVRKIFPFSDHKLGKRACLYSHIGLCNPCPNLGIDRAIYLKNIRNIRLVLSRKFNIVRKALEKEMSKLSKEQKYEEATMLRDKINALDYITQKKVNTQEFLKNPNLTEDIRNQELDSLQSLLTVHGSQITGLHRIECFDVAHLSGSSATASMVVLIDGEKENSEYKHFKVKQKNGQSDYGSMREIVRRRIKHLDDWGRPDLIIVDGGLGQVKIFDEICKNYKLEVVGVAKHPDRLVFVNGNKIRLTSESLRLVSRIRDEAHRFARRLHHKLIYKALLTQAA